MRKFFDFIYVTAITILLFPLALLAWLLMMWPGKGAFR